MTDVIALSELSDEPPASPWEFSPRMIEVLNRLPANSVRISNALLNAGILTVSALTAKSWPELQRVKNLGRKYADNIERALAAFDLQLADGPTVIRDGATAAEAHVQRLMRWIEERMARCERVGDVAIFDHETAVVDTERAVLEDVMLILDGREPTNTRRYST